MKIMNVALNIDVANIEHVEALEVFMRTLGGHSIGQTVTMGTAPVISMTTAAENATTPADGTEDKVTAEKAARAKARKEKADKLKAEAEEYDHIKREEDDKLKAEAEEYDRIKREEDDNLVDEEGEDTDDSLLGDDEPVIDTAMLRTLTSEKLNVEDATVKAANTKAVKAKLVEYGVNNVTTLPEAKFKEYYEFITAL